MEKWIPLKNKAAMRKRSIKVRQKKLYKKMVGDPFGMNICFVTDPLVTTAGAVRPAILLGREFYKKGYNVTIITPNFTAKIKEMFDKEGIRLVAVGPKNSLIQGFPTFGAWMQCLIRHNVVKDVDDFDFIVNTSSSLITPSHVYYAQGLMMETLEDMAFFMPLRYRFAYYFLRSMFKLLERNMVRKIRHFSRAFVANSFFCASIYRKWGFKVDGVISPPLDACFFKPSTTKPTEDYVLTYFGVYSKEGVAPIIKAVADAGVKIKAFGFAPSFSNPLSNYGNIEFLGRVSDEKLVELYSNALYTLFVFSHEPFGYVPVESMACGTPVLAYNRQGPAETVIDNETGWLADSDSEIIALAIKLWKDGYNNNIRRRCRHRALTYDVKNVFKQWSKFLKLSLT
ncbi:MAG: glycosyltransferase [Candidatus Bathyarchaeales archaeon]